MVLKDSKKCYLCIAIRQLFFKHLKIENLSDTILVQNRTKIFLCPTAAGMYQEELIKKDLGKFYEKYGSVLDNPKLIQLFEKNNKVKILWINSGNEGELFQLEDSALHKNKKLENRLIKEKAFLIFDETPKSIDTVSLSVTIIYPKIEKAVLKTYNLSKSNENWKIDSQME